MKTRCKQLLALTLLLALCLSLTSCAAYSNQRYYERAQLLLGSGECREAAELFSQLGEYADSADYALYAAALCALQEGDTTLTRTNLMQIAPFKSSERYLRYLDGIDAEKAGELQAALDIFRALGSFEDCAERADALEDAIPEQTLRQGRQLMSSGDYEAARELLLSLNGYGQSAALADACTSAIARQAYQAAEKLAAEGDYLSAMNAFSAMGDTLDAAQRAAECRSLLLKEAEEAFLKVTVDTAQSLSDKLSALAEDADFSALQARLQERFGQNMTLLEQAQDAQPFVLLGQYPMGESGSESDLLWQVLRADGSTLTLLCTAVIDASAVATTTDLALDDSLSAAQLLLPSAADLAALDNLTCTATPYAAAQGASVSGGAAVYWLRDTLESGVHPVISESGSLTLPEDSQTPGIRPIITLDLNDYTFTQGSGTESDPFR